MATTKYIFLSRNADALRNGSFVRVQANSHTRYVLGDYAGTESHKNGIDGYAAQYLSDGYTSFTRAEARQITEGKYK